MDKLSKVRAEIERRIDYQNKCVQNHYRLTGKVEEEIILEYKQLLAFIDSLQKEPVNEDLSKAAIDAADNDMQGRQIMESSHDDRMLYSRIFRRGFKAGAEWYKAQILKDAVDMVVGYWMPNGLSLNVDETENIYNIDEGDKVKMLIIKEE
jgi:hypothetical protein